MPLVSMRQLLDEAARGGYGVGAFNVNNMEQIQAIMEAARETSSPVIIQASRGARSYTNDRFLWHLMQAAVELYPEIPVALHLDHGNEPATCISAIDLGFTSVMMDGSLEADGKTPASFDYNVAVTKEVVEYAHARGVTVEGRDRHARRGRGRARLRRGAPDRSGRGRRVRATRRASTRSPSRSEPPTAPTSSRRSPTGEVLKMDLIEEIHRRLPDTHLVMHGSSSVPPELVAQVNQYGGALKPAWGVPVKEIQLGIRHGVRKINVDTDSRLAVTGAIRKVFAESPEKFDPRDYLKPARAAMQELIARRMEDFGQAGHAGDYEPLSLEEMREGYAAATAAA